MSQDNVEILRRANAAFNSGDREGMLAVLHPDVELRDLQHAPDAPEVMYGTEAVMAYLDQWDAVFDTFTAEIEEYIDAGDSVIVVAHWHATGRDSGLATNLHTADLYEFADGKIVRATTAYADKHAALKAVGIEE
jgi:ketosteroid isomerase-like protein